MVVYSVARAAVLLPAPRHDLGEHQQQRLAERRRRAVGRHETANLDGGVGRAEHPGTAPPPGQEFRRRGAPAEHTHALAGQGVGGEDVGEADDRGLAGP
jgi:hypothetical protein